MKKISVHDKHIHGYYFLTVWKTGCSSIHPKSLLPYLETLIAILKNSARDSVFNHFIELVQQVGHFSSQNVKIERLLLPIALSEIRDQKKDF